MSVYVSVPQVPIQLKFEEPFEDVVAHMRELVTEKVVQRYEWDGGQVLLVNYGVINSVLFNDGHRAVDLGDLRSVVETRVERRDPP